jgi:endonuclease/exonuclease/phosphatase (EEP) superfamily protein YafD
MSETRRTITVMTLNVGNGVASDDQVVAALLGAGADVVGIEELNQRQAGAIDARIAGAFPYRASFGDSYEGRGILSRYPLLSVEELSILADRPDVRAVIDIDGVPLTVIVGHPRPQVMERGRVRFRRASLRQLLMLANLAQEASPAVLLGDFNMSPRHPGHARFTRIGLIDAFAAAGRGGGRTFPLRLALGGGRLPPERRRYVRLFPVMRFDHIWHTADLETVEAWVGPDAGSDHAPVLARIAVPGEDRGDGDEE